MSDLSDIVNEFLVESYENLDQLDRSLVSLERDPSERATLASIFRTIHTIKGTSGFLGFSKLEAVTHVGENLLSRLRDGVLTLTPPIASGLLAMVDAVRAILANIESAGQEGDGEYSALIAGLTALQEANGDGAANATPAQPAQAGGKDQGNDEAAALFAETQAELAAAESAQANPGVTSPSAETQPEVTALPASPASASMAEGDHLQFDTPGAAGDQGTHRDGISESNIRVDVSLLEKLMNLCGELVLARNRIRQRHSPAED